MKTEIFIMIAIVGLLFGLASPLPIWPGPTTYRHLPPGIISVILMLIAGFGTMKKGSKIVGIIGFIYGILAIIAGILFSYIITLLGVSTDPGSRISIVILGTILALGAGVTSIILGFKAYRATKI